MSIQRTTTLHLIMPCMSCMCDTIELWLPQLVEHHLRLPDITGCISINAARCLEHSILCKKGRGSPLQIEKRESNIQNVNKHNSNASCCLMTPFSTFFFFFLVNPVWKYCQNITWQKCHSTSPCYDFKRHQTSLMALDIEWGLQDCYRQNCR